MSLSGLNISAYLAPSKAVHKPVASSQHHRIQSMPSFNLHLIIVPLLRIVDQPALPLDVVRLVIVT